MTKTKTFLLVTLINVLIVLIISGCGVGSAQVKDPADKNEIIVFAASSLSPLLKEIKAEYEKEYPETELMLNTSGTQVLKTQIEQGAKADLFLAAREKDVLSLKEKGLVKASEPFAGNELVVIVSKEGQQKIQEIQNLAQDDIRLVLANETAPIGEYSIKLLGNLQSSGNYGEQFVQKTLENVVSYESNEQDVLTKIIYGEADGGIVYRSSLTSIPASNQKPATVPFDAKFNVQSDYYLAELTHSTAEAKPFINWLNSANAKAMIKKYGYLVSE